MNEFYGEDLSTVTLDDLTRMASGSIKAPSAEIQSFSASPGWSAMHDKFAIDLSVPRILSCKSEDIDNLIAHDVSKYLSFAPVKKIRIGETIAGLIDLPTSRNAVFQEKSLTMTEKRSLMKLFKSTILVSNTVFESSANACAVSIKHEPLTGGVQNAVEYLKSEFLLDRPDLISGIIHGACLFTGPASCMSTKELLRKLEQFIASLEQYERGCPFLVPLYGNGDIPQAFARTAAVNGCVHILACDHNRLLSELEEVAPDHKPVILRSEDQVKNDRVFHGLACIKTRPDLDDVSLVVIQPRNFDTAPIFALCLPNSGDGHTPVRLCPTGHTLIHFVQQSSSNIKHDAFVQEMRDFLRDEQVALEAVVVNKVLGLDDLFGLDSEFQAARTIINCLLGREVKEPIPVPTPSTLNEVTAD